MRISIKFLPVTLALLAGCSTLNPLGGSSSYSCNAPEGVTCTSISGVYSNAIANNLTSQRDSGLKHAANPESKNSPATTAGISGYPMKGIASGMPIRTSPRVLRVWFAPWEDQDNILRDQSYAYLPIDQGHWMIEHNQHRISEQFAPARAPVIAHPDQTRADVQSGEAFAAPFSGLAQKPDQPGGTPLSMKNLAPGQ